MLFKLSGLLITLTLSGCCVSHYTMFVEQHAKRHMRERGYGVDCMVQNRRRGMTLSIQGDMWRRNSPCIPKPDTNAWRVERVDLYHEDLGTTLEGSPLHGLCIISVEDSNKVRALLKDDSDLIARIEFGQGTKTWVDEIRLMRRNVWDVSLFRPCIKF